MSPGGIRSTSRVSRRRSRGSPRAVTRITRRACPADRGRHAGDAAQHSVRRREREGDRREMREAVTGRGVVREGVLTRVALGLSACALTALVYIPFVDSPFVLDDRTLVLLNPSLADLADVRGILLYDAWHPLVTATLAIDRALSGVSPLGFHITSGILHLLVVTLVFSLASRPPLSPDTASDRRGRDWAAFAAAAAFGVDPLTARSVAYVSARADLLCAAGVLLVVMLSWGAWRARRKSVTRTRVWVRMALAAIAAGATLTTVPWGLRVHNGAPRLYLTTAVLLLAAARGAHTIFARSRTARAGAVLAVAMLAVLTIRTLTLWADPVALWRAQVTRTPANWDAHLGYADALREASHCGEAAGEYEIALRLRPGQEDARRGLAGCRR